MSTHRYLEVTYRNGMPVAAYFYLPRQEDDISVSVVETSPGLLTDVTTDGRAIGIEITSPSHVTLAALNQSLIAAGQSPANADEIAPLLGLAGTVS